jgi:hypothetical protein
MYILETRNCLKQFYRANTYNYEHVYALTNRRMGG